MTERDEKKNGCEKIGKVTYFQIIKCKAFNELKKCNYWPKEKAIKSDGSRFVDVS